MDLQALLQEEIRRSILFFLKHTNTNHASPGTGLVADSSRKPGIASIAAVGFGLTAWVIASERGYLGNSEAKELTRSTLRTLLERASHFRGFFAHFLAMDSAQRHRKCEYSTIDTALCLNGVITAAAYYQDSEIQELAEALLERVDWQYFVFERGERTLFRMAYNPDEGGDYVNGEPGFIYQWDMAAEQKMMYLQAAGQLEPELARRLYAGFEREKGNYAGHEVLFNPGGNLFAYQFSEAWLDTRRCLDPDGIDWFHNTRQATLANRCFCLDQASHYRTYHENSWGLSAGDSPWGYDVSGAPPCRGAPQHNGTVSIFSALAALPFTPEESQAMLCYLYQEHPHTWGEYGFYDAYNLAVSPAWYSRTIYGINKGCSLILLENALSGLVWDIYTNSATIQKALAILRFKSHQQGA